jgi:hypothetical protein
MGDQRMSDPTFKVDQLHRGDPRWTPAIIATS